jgi:predicted nucleic acid-binding protein
MAEVYLFDTDVLIGAGRGESEAIDALEQAAENAPLAISVVTEMELIVGCRNKDELAALNRFLRRFDTIPLRPAISEQATALLRTFRLSHGLLIAYALIAATAIVDDVPFISKNQRDYRFINTLGLLPYPDPFSQAE